MADLNDENNNKNDILNEQKKDNPCRCPECHLI